MLVAGNRRIEDIQINYTALQIFFLAAAFVFSPIPTTRAADREKQDMSAITAKVPLPQTPDSLTARGFGMNVYTVKDFERAEKIVDDYVTTKHTWENDAYTLCLFEIHPYVAVVTFLAFHMDDAKAVAPGGGKSVFIEFDMNKMVVLRELGGQ